jgi:ribosomal protein S19
MARSCAIIPAFVGGKFLIHNDRSYTPLTVTEQMVSHKLGEFASTTKLCEYKQKKDVKKKK